MADGIQQLDPSIFAGERTEQVILRAALARFAAYGYKRTSMEDIAREAMVSRPTLYSYFKNKRTILRVVSQSIHDDVLAKIKAALSTKQDLKKRLVAAFWAWSEPFVSILFASPHGSELIGESSVLAADISLDATQQFHELVSSALKTAASTGDINLSRANLTVAGATDFLVLALNGISSSATDAKTYKARLKTLANLFMLAVSSPIDAVQN